MQFQKAIKLINTIKKTPLGKLQQENNHTSHFSSVFI